MLWKELNGIWQDEDCWIIKSGTFKRKWTFILRVLLWPGYFNNLKNSDAPFKEIFPSFPLNDQFGMSTPTSNRRYPGKQ